MNEGMGAHLKVGKVGKHCKWENGRSSLKDRKMNRGIGAH